MVYVVVVALEDEICKAAVTARLSKKFPFFLATTVALFFPLALWPFFFVFL